MQFLDNKNALYISEILEKFFSIFLFSILQKIIAILVMCIILNFNLFCNIYVFMMKQ